MENVNILISLRQDNIVQYLILLESLAATNKLEGITLYIIGETDDVSNYKNISIFLKKYSLKFKYFLMYNNGLMGLDNAELSVLYSAYLLPIDVKKVIYLNANLLLKGDLIKLWNLDMGVSFFAACEDRLISKGVDMDELKFVHISETGIYFNTDIMLINLYAVRESCLKEICQGFKIQNEEIFPHGLKTFLNKYMLPWIMEIENNEYNVQIMSYRIREREENYYKAKIINYGNVQMSWKNKREVYDKLYQLWWKYAEITGIMNRDVRYIKRKERLELINAKTLFLMSYLRFALRKLVDSGLDIQLLDRINYLKKTDLWNSFYFFEKNWYAYEKKYKEIIKGYRKIQVHKMFGGGTAMFFLTIICYNILRIDDDVLHILIPNVMFADSRIDNPDFYVHNEYVLNYLENAYIPRKEEKNFLRYIISRYFYYIDFSRFSEFSPVKYEDLGGTYEELEKLEIIKFNENDRKKGELFLHEHDICGDFVCIAPRNNAYKKMVYLKTVGPNDYLNHRNGTIESYLKAVEVIQSAGFDLIQMGKVNNVSFPQEYGILNFSKEYDELLDLYLMSKCKFVIGDGSGLMNIADMFSKPTIQANWELITSAREIMGFLKEKKDIILPVKYWNDKKKRYLSLREQLILEANYKESRFEEKVLELGYKAIPNSAEELEAAAREMVEHILGNKDYSEEEKQLQYISRKLIVESAQKHHMRYPKCNIAIGFLKKNKWYLE